jgi:hypothetical protein
MIPPENYTDEERAEALYRRLRDQANPQPGALSPEEAALVDQLTQAARSIPSDLQFKASLAARLANYLPADTPPAQAARQTGLLARLLSLWRPLATAIPVLALLLGLAWTLRTLLPSQPPALEPTGLASLSPEQATSLPVGLPELTATPTPLPPPTQAATSAPAYPEFTSPFLPGDTLALATEFPPGPEQVMIYNQIPPTQPLTAEDALAAAANLGVAQGSAYRTPGELSGQTVLVVTDGKQRAMYIGSLDNFTYEPDYANTLQNAGQPLPLEQRTQIAADFLQQRGLLDFEYQVEPAPYEQHPVRFVPGLEGRPVRYSSFSSPQIDVWVDGQGLVERVIYNKPQYFPVTSLPILSAEQAWQAFLQGDAPQGIETSNLIRFDPGEMQTWQRSYPSGQRSDLYGYAEILEAAEQGGTPFISFNNLTVLGDLASLAQQWRVGVFIHVWGEIQPGPAGSLALAVQGWEEAQVSDEALFGTLEWRDGQAVFTADESIPGQPVLILPDLPAEVPAGPVSVRGVRLPDQPDALYWWTVQTGDFGGYGGGGGGGSFAELSLEPGPGPNREPLPTPLPLPYQPGDAVAGLEGRLLYNIYENADGTQRTELLFYSETGLEQASLTARLETPDPAPLLPLHWLPIRIWGSVVAVQNEQIVIQLERFEEAQPGLRFQAWLGTYESVTLEGQQVLLFTTLEGEQFVLSPTIDSDPDSDSGSPGERVVIEGLVSERTFGGFPVIDEHASGVAGDMQSLDGYELVSDDPNVFPPDVPQPANGRLVIDQIELAYYATDLSHGGGYDPGYTFYVQPVWRFTGRYENGIYGEILVQALQAEYLK